MARDLLQTGQMHANTGVFDVNELPALPGFGKLGVGVARAKAMAVS